MKIVSIWILKMKENECFGWFGATWDVKVPGWQSRKLCKKIAKFRWNFQQTENERMNFSKSEQKLAKQFFKVGKLTKSPNNKAKTAQTPKNPDRPQTPICFDKQLKKARSRAISEWTTSALNWRTRKQPNAKMPKNVNLQCKDRNILKIALPKDGKDPLWNSSQ